MIDHFRYYLKLNGHVLLKGIPLNELLVLKYPFKMPEAAKPPLLSVDVTDACDLVCQYCNNPHFPHPRTMMSGQVVDCLLRQIELSRINRVRLGGGEPTLHPCIGYIMKEIAHRTKFLSIVTNGHWTNPDIATELLESKVALIELSVDAGGAEVYERSRRNASYSRLMQNLAGLHTARDKMKSKTMIKIRLMLRPSTAHLEKEETARLLRYCDCVLPQWLMKHPETDYNEDVFMQRATEQHSYPVCSVPFKDLQIRPDGRIPLCPAKGCALKVEDQVWLGNVCDDNLLDVWRSAKLKELRAAHRTRQGAILEICRNCHYG
jgi:pyruvate-formate lyase-activating enzyme